MDSLHECKQSIHSTMLYQSTIPLKADRPHPQDYPPNSPDYRHTDRFLRLVMVLPCPKHDGNGKTVQAGGRYKWPDGQTDRWMLPSALSPYFAKLAVDKKLENRYCSDIVTCTL